MTRKQAANSDRHTTKKNIFSFFHNFFNQKRPSLKISKGAKMKTKKLIALFAILLIFTQSALADFTVITNTTIVSQPSENVSSDFEVTTYSFSNDFLLSSANKEINVCACSLFADVIMIQNSGSIEELYTVSTDKDYSKLSMQTVDLKPGEEAEVINYITPDCNVYSDNLKTTVTSSSGVSKEMIQKINSAACNDIVGAISNKTLQTTPCVAVKGNFTVKNPSDYVERYTFDSDMLQNYVSFLPTPLTVYPNETRLVLFQYNTSCDVYGSYNGSIIITAEKSGVEQALPVSLSINRTYMYGASAQASIESCNYASTQIPITIKNNEKFTNAFDITIPDSQWFKLENKSVTLLPNEQKTIYVTSHPEWKDAGAEYLSYTVTSRFGSIQKSGTILVNIPDCYKFSIWKTFQDNACFDEKNYNFIVYNGGIKTNKFTVSVEGNDVLNNSFSKDVLLGAGLTQKITVPMNLSNKDYTAIFKVKASLLNDTYVQWYTQKVDVKSADSCYNLDIEAKGGLNANKTFGQANITLTNSGLKDGSYSISVDSAPWVSINRNDLFVRQNSTETILLRTNPGNITGDYKATLKLVEKSSNATFTKEFVIKANPKTLSQIASEYFNFTKEFYNKNKDLIQITLITIAGIIIMAGVIYLIYWQRKKMMDKRRKLIMSAGFSRRNAKKR